MKYILSILLVVSYTTVTCAQSPGGIQNPIIWKYGDVNDNQFNEASENNINHYKFIEPFSSNTKQSQHSIKKPSRGVSVFAVFDDQGNRKVLTYNSGYDQICLTSESVKANNQNYVKNLTETGFPRLVSYTGMTTGRKKSSETNLNLFEEHKDDLKVTEVIVYHSVLPKLQRQQVETYLSLKYGISLPLDSTYYNAHGDVIWNGKYSGAFGHRVTGLVRDDKSNLAHYQSENVDNPHKFSIKIAQPFAQDLDYILWSDNNGNLDFVPISENFDQLSRSYSIVGHTKEVANLVISVDPNELNGFDSSTQTLYLDIEGEEKLAFKRSSSNQYIVHAALDFRSEQTYNVGLSTKSLFPKDMDSEREVSLFPNPATVGQQFSLYFPISPKHLNVDIYDSSGQLIYQKLIPPRSTVFSHSIDKAGQYLVRVKQEEDWSEIFKLIVF